MGCRYENKIAAEIEVCMRLRGENGIMKKKFDGMQSQIDKELQNCEKLSSHEQELQKVWHLNLAFSEDSCLPCHSNQDKHVFAACSMI